MEVIQRQREGQWGSEEYKNDDTLRIPITGHVSKTKEGYKRLCTFTLKYIEFFKKSFLELYFF